MHIEHLQGKWLTWYGQYMHVDLNQVYRPIPKNLQPFDLPGPSSKGFEAYIKLEKSSRNGYATWALGKDWQIVYADGKHVAWEETPGTNASRVVYKSADA